MKDFSKRVLTATNSSNENEDVVSEELPKRPKGSELY